MTTLPVQAVRLQWQSSHKFVSRYDISDFFALNLKRYAIVFGYIGAFLKLSSFEFLATMKCVYFWKFFPFASFKSLYTETKNMQMGKKFTKKIFSSYHCIVRPLAVRNLNCLSLYAQQIRKLAKYCRIQIWLGKCLSDCKMYSYLYFHVPAQSVSFTRFKLSTWSICPLIFHCQKAWTTRVETVSRHFPLLFWCKFCKVKENTKYIILLEFHFSLNIWRTLISIDY